MRVDRSVRVGVVSSLIATVVFLYFLDPILSVVGRLVLSVSGQLFQSYIDSLCRQMAVGVSPKTVFWSFASFAGLITGVMSGITAASAAEAFRPARRIRPPTTPGISDRRLRGRAISLFCLTLVMTLFMLVGVWSQWFCLRATTSFEQHVRILAPYVTDQEVKEIWSSWALMQSEKDYLQLYDRINRLAATHGLRLPANTLFSFRSLL